MLYMSDNYQASLDLTGQRTGSLHRPPVSNLQTNAGNGYHITFTVRALSKSQRGNVQGEVNVADENPNRNLRNSSSR